MESAKMVGMILWAGAILAWVFGIILFSSSPVVGVGLVVVGFILTYMSFVWKRERRHQELVDATKQRPPSESG